MIAALKEEHPEDKYYAAMKKHLEYVKSCQLENNPPTLTFKKDKVGFNPKLPNNFRRFLHLRNRAKKQNLPIPRRPPHTKTSRVHHK